MCDISNVLRRTTCRDSELNAVNYHPLTRETIERDLSCLRTIRFTKHVHEILCTELRIYCCKLNQHEGR